MYKDEEREMWVELIELRCRWEDNIKMDHKEIGWEIRPVLGWEIRPVLGHLCIGTRSRLL
jgi:hypothetical protein